MAHVSLSVFDGSSIGDWGHGEGHLPAVADGATTHGQSRIPFNDVPALLPDPSESSKRSTDTSEKMQRTIDHGSWT